MLWLLFFLLFVYVCLRVLVFFIIQEAWCSVTRAVPPTGANIAVVVLKFDLLRVQVTFLAACRCWVGPWDGGDLGAVLLLRRCELFVVAVVFAAVVLFLLLSSLRVFGLLGHRRGTALGHPCGMPPTGANIAVLLFKTWLAPDSTYI